MGRQSAVQPGTPAFEEEAFTPFWDTYDTIRDRYAGEEVELSEIRVRSETPGFTAEIRTGDAPAGPFEDAVSGSQTVGADTTFEVDGSSRY